MNERQPDPRHKQITPIPVATKFLHQHGRADALNAELLQRVDIANLVHLLLNEQWQGKCEIVPNYVPEFAQPETRPMLVIRCAIHSDHPNHEPDSYSYLRHSGGPCQGFFWDCYGDDMHSIEVAIIALSQAPCPEYCGPQVFKIALNPKP